MVLQVKVIPRAQRSEVVGPMADGTLKVKVAAVPEDGKANEELTRLSIFWFFTTLKKMNKIKNIKNINITNITKIRLMLLMSNLANLKTSIRSLLN